MGTSADCLFSFIHPPKAPSYKPLSSRRGFALLVAALSLTPLVSLAAPLQVEETVKIPSPDPTLDNFPVRLAVEGDTIIATGVKYDGDIERHDAFLFQRQSNGTWKYLRTLATTSCDSGEVGEDTCLASVAIRNGVAVVAANKVHVFERQSNGSWVEAPSDNFTRAGEAAVGTGVVLTSQLERCVFNAEATRKNSSGTWTQVMTFPGTDMSGCDDWGITGQAIGISVGNRVITSDAWGSGVVDLYEPTGSTWTRTASLVSPINSYFGGAVDIDDSRALVSGSFQAPIHVFNRDSGAWGHTVDINSPDSVRTGSPGVLKVRDLIVAGLSGDPHRGGSVAVYKQTATNKYQQVARLVASDSAAQQQYLGWGDVDAYVTGSTARIVAGAIGGVYVFDLNKWGTTPAPLQENFEQGSASRWTPMAGSTFTVVTSAGSKVYRQSAVTGDAGSFMTGIDWKNQAIEADIKPTAFDGTDRWVGLALRRTDASNYYYATLRKSNALDIRRMKNGAFTTLKSVPLQVVLNRNYRVRFEAIGTLLRVYVDGRLAAQVRDTALTHGHAGFRMYKARADFDDVIVSQNPQLVLMEQQGTPYIVDEQWKFALGNWASDYSTGYPRFVQQNTSGDARAVSLFSADDQVVQTRVKLNSFGSGTGTRWFGVMARYVDAKNYYYVTMRRENTISLRRMVNGVIQELDSAPFTVSAGTSYNLRLEAVGSSLRAYVNGNLLLEASDTTHKSGRYGPVMYSAEATYDNFTAWEP